ncbi:MAG: hypothetical protein OEY75_10965, partial [Hylemonella sp.]|nr:hypothetical protein [Hylemonella sp.]
GWAKEFLWPNTTWWSDIATSVIGAYSQATLLEFMRRLLGTRVLTPRLDRLIQWLIAAHLLLSIGFFVSLQTFTPLSSWVVVATMGLILFVGIYCTLVKQHPIARFFLVSSSLWLCGSLMVGLKYYGVLPTNDFTSNGWQIGSISEMLLLAFALAYRFNQIRRKASEDVRQVNANLEARLQAREAELTRSHERLRKIELQQSLSQERQRLMQDMHDGLGSSLTSALRMAERGRMDKEQVALVIRGCIDDLKLAIDSYEEVDADLLLLLATLRFRLEPRLEGTGIAMRWEVQSVPPLTWLTPRNALHILRILQEAITNIIRHAEATEIRVATGMQGDRVVVTISDNGKGFLLPQALNGNGKGLPNQMRRAQAIGAEINWETSEKGTTLTLSLPIALQANAADKYGSAGVPPE